MRPCGDELTGFKVKVLTVEQQDALVTPVVTGITTVITIDVLTAGFYHYRFWLSDSATDPTQSLHLPTDQEKNEWEGDTDSSGDASITFKNNDTSRTWYLWGYIVKTNVSAAITAGT